MSSQLEEILEKKKEQLDKESQDWQARRDEWLRQITALLDTIREWIKPLEDKQYLSVETTEITITEELLGTYQAPSMIITFFTGERVQLIPKGLHIIAGQGRVDLKLGQREIMIIGQDEEPGWFFAEREGRGKPKYFEFSKDNFEQLLQEYLESA